MEIFYCSRDDSLQREISAAMGTEVLPLKDAGGLSDRIVFFDLDTMKTGEIRHLSEKNFVVALTRQKRTGPVLEAASLGAYETLQRPLKREIVSEVIGRLRDILEEIRRPVAVKQLPPTPTCAIVGHSAAIMDVCKKLARLALVEAPVLITGETGTGKELIAESIAQLSSRFGKPFVVVNCAAVPDNLLESELFGFEKGSFTGAVSAKEGMLKIADEGTVFFDEVGELPLALQGKLLRFLQTQAFYPLGSTQEVQVDVRVISATNRNLSAMVREGRFREDLYHRLRVTALHIPPLRERREDIPALIEFFIGRYRHTASRPIQGITKAFLKKMTTYDWPGNIRELENAVRSAIALSKTKYLTTHELREFDAGTLPAEGAGLAGAAASVVIPFVKEAVERGEKNLYDRIHLEIDKPLLEFVLSLAKENQSEAARILGINRLTLRKKLKY